MVKVVVTHEKDVCIGCGACAAVCPDSWEMSDDGKSHLKGAKNKGGNVWELECEEGCNQAAADGCPVQCIHVEKAK